MTPELQASAADQAYCTRWSQAYHAYRARQWTKAAATFRALGGDRDDAVAAIYTERAASNASDPPAPDWDGVEVFDTK